VHVAVHVPGLLHWFAVQAIPSSGQGLVALQVAQSAQVGQLSPLSHVPSLSHGVRLHVSAFTGVVQPEVVVQNSTVTWPGVVVQHELAG
jgi:hypothetical protein